MSTNKTKVAILGGGMASLACAWRLSDPSQAGAYDITVYQMGWRLGGKGASGRNPKAAQRVEEHGLHVWMGFYHQAFTLMREAYAELRSRGLRSPMAPLGRFEAAFEAHDLIVVAEQLRARWGFWRFPFPRNDERPGTPHSTPWPSPSSYAKMATEMLGRGLRALQRRRDDAKANPEQPSQARERAANFLRAALQPERRAELLAELFDQDDELRRWAVFLEFVVVNLRGLAIDLGLGGLSLDDLDDLDYREWLAEHGASPLLLESAGLRGMYDMSFAYLDGDLDQPDFAAGVFLRFFARMFLGYKGAVFWKMQGGMGDVVFAPMYQVLRDRGVRFEFFHRVDALGLSEDPRAPLAVERVELTRQAAPLGERYEPLVDVDGLPCWPSEPRWDQLRDPAARSADGNLESARTDGLGERRVLTRGEDFDEVVLGISVAALPRICAELIERNPAFAAMCRETKTTATQAAQLWLRSSAEELGWEGPPAILDAYGGAMNTWADMTHVAEIEDWPEFVGHLAYFCGPYSPRPYAEAGAPSPAELQRDFEDVFAGVLELASSDLGELWPRATVPPQRPGAPLRWSELVAPEGVEGSARLEHQYVRVNTEPTERYVLSAKGATRYRLRPHETGCMNLTFAGDWTRTTLNYGCIEGAVQSGEAAARAVDQRARARRDREPGRAHASALEWLQRPDQSKGDPAPGERSPEREAS